MAKYSSTVSYNIKTTLDASGVAKLQAEIRNVEAELQRMANQHLISSSSFNDATGKLKQLRTQISAAFNPNIGMLDTRKLTDGLKATRLNLTDLQGAFRTAGTAGEAAFVNTLGRLGKLDTGIKSVSKTTDKVFNTIGNTVRWGVIASGFQQILNSAHQTVQYVQDLDTSLTNIMMVTGNSRDMMNEFAQSANDSAKALSSTTVAMTDAALVFAQQGFNTSDSEQLAQRSTKLANISQQETAVTSDQITTIMNAYDFTGDLEQIDAAMDSWAEVANVSAADVGELATASQKAASTAKTTGVTLDQLNAQIATIESVTREAPENIGNALKTIYSRFADIKMGGTLEDGVDLGTIAQTLEKVGVNVLDGSGKMNDVGDVMEDLMNVWGELDQTQQNAISTVVAGRYQLSRFQALMNRSDLYKEYLGASQNAEGTANQMQDIYANSLEGRLNKLQATAEGIFNDIFNTDDFYGMIDALSQVLDLTNEWVNAIGGGGVALQGLGAIATRVFSDNIASSLTNFIQNRNVAQQQKQNKESARQDLKVAGLDDLNSGRNQDLIDFISTGLDHASTMSEQQQAAYNEQIDRTVQLKKQQLEQEQKIYQSMVLTNAAANQVEGVEEQNLVNLSRDKESGNLEVDSEGLDNLFLPAEESNLMQEKIEGLRQDLDNFSTTAIKTAERARTSFDSFKDGAASMEQLQKAAVDVAADLSKVTRTLGQNHTEAQALGEIYNRLDDSLHQLEVDAENGQPVKVENIENANKVLQELITKLQQVRGAAENGVYLDANALFNTRGELTATDERVASEQQRMAGMGQQYVTQERIAKVIDAVGAIGQLSFSWQSFQSLGSLWANDDINEGEKLTQTVMNLATTVPMAASGIIEMTKALSALGLSAAPVGIALAAITATIAGISIAVSHHAQEIKDAMADESEVLSAAVESSKGNIEAAKNFDTLYQSYLKTGHASEDFIQSCHETAKALGVSGANALIASGNFDALANSIQKAKDSDLQDVINKSNATLNGANSRIFREGDITNGSLFSDAAHTLNRSFNSSLYKDLLGFKVNPGSLQEEDLKSNMSNSDFLRFSNEYQAALQKRIDSLTNLSEEEIEAAGGQESVNQQLKRAKKDLSDWTSGIVETEEYQAVDTAFSERAKARVQQSGFQKQLKGLNSVDDILNVFSRDKNTGEYFNTLASDAERLKFAIDSVTDAQQKMLLEGEQARATLHDKLLEQEGMTEDVANSIVEQADKRLSDKQLIDFVGQLDVDLTKENIQSEINQYLNKQLSLELTAKTNLDTTTLGQLNKSLDGLDSLKTSYESAYKKQGGFTSSEVAGLLQKNPEYINYLVKVGDLYQLNQELMDDWTAASEKQKTFLDQQMDTSFGNLSAENEAMRKVNFSSVDTDYGDLDTSSVADEVESLNQALASGESTVKEYADGISNLSDKLSSLGNLGNFNEDSTLGLDPDELAQIGSLYETIASSIQEVMEQTTKQFQRGEISLNDYLGTIGDLAKTSAKTEAAMRGMRKEGNKWIAVAEDGTKATDETSESLASQVNETEDAGDRLNDLSGVYDTFSTDGEALIDWFGEFGDSINNSSIQAAQATGEYQRVIDSLAETASNFYFNNQEALSSFITGFNETAEASARITQTQMNELIASAGQGQAAFSATLGGLMSQNTAFTAGMVSNLLANMESSVAIATSGISSMITGVEQLLSSFSVVINGSVESTGTTEIGGFGLDLSGSGILGAASEVLGDLSGSLTIPTFRMTISSEDASFGNKDAAAASFAEGAGIVSNVFGSDGAGISDFLGGSPGAGSTPYIPSSSGSGGGGGGGGGGGSSYTPKTKDPIEDELDRYERVDTLLKDAENRYDRLNADRGRLTGFDMADDMEKEVNLLNQQIKLHEEKLEIQKQEAEELKNELSSQYGVTFDGEGFIQNYAAIHNQLVNEVNSLIDQYNAATTEEEQDALEEQIEAAQKRLDKFNDTYKRYDELWAGDLQETLNTLEDIKDKIEDIRIEIMNTRVDAVDSLQDLQESLNEVDGIFDHFGEDSGLRDAELSVKNLATYFDIANDSASQLYDTLIRRAKDKLNSGLLSDEQRKALEQDIAMYENARKQIGKGSMEAGGTGLFDMSMNNIHIMSEQIRQYKTTGTSSIFGENSKALYETAKDAYNQAVDLLKDFEDEYKNLHEAILDMIDEIDDKIEKRREQYENITDELDHQREIIELIHGDEAYTEINQVLAAQQKNYQASIHEMQQTLNYWKDLQKGMKEGSEEWEAINEKIMDTQSKLNDLVEESLKNLQEKYNNTVNNILGTWTKNAFGGIDLDWVSQEWELINRNADYYLDDVNAAYETQKLQGKYLELLDGTNDLHIQQMITEQMKQQLGYLRDKEKLSEYDVSYANAQLEILQKRIALEDAQRNKSQMQLRRDTQGNYSYVYTANEGDVASAEGDLLDAQNNAYNLSKEQMKKTQDDSLSALQDANQLLNDIWTNANLKIDEKTERTQTVINSLKEYLQGTSEQLSESEKNIINDFINMTEMLTGENAGRLEDVYNQIVGGNQDAFDLIDTRWSTSLSNWIYNLDEFNLYTDNAFQELIENSVSFSEEVDAIADEVNQDFSSMGDTIQSVTDRTDELAASTSDFINQLKNDAGTVKEYENTLESYRQKISDVTNSMRAYQDQVKDLQSSLTAKEQENANLRAENEALKNPSNNSSSDSGGGDGSFAGSGYSRDDLAWGIAQNIWTYGWSGGWGDDPTRSGKLTGAYGEDFARYVQDLINEYSYPDDSSLVNIEGSKEFSSYNLLGYDTGGYTGTWSDGDENAKNGKLAYLHQKELVLNANDTENILKAVDIVRQMTQALKSSAIADVFTNMSSAFPQAQNDTVEQNVHITAEFPNANNASEIESALLSLNERAVQYSFKRK